MLELSCPNWKFLCQDSMPQRLEGGTSVDFCDTSNCRTNLTLQEDQLSGTEGSSMTKCPCVAMLIAKRSRHGEATDGW